MILYGGVEGDCETAVKNFIDNCLEYDPNVACEHHHDEEDGCGCHGDDCDCGSEGGCGCGCH